MMMHRATMLAMKAQDVEAHLVQQRATNQGKKAAVTALREARWRWQVAGDAAGQVSTAGAGASGDDGLIAATFTQPGSLGLGLVPAAGAGFVVSSVIPGGQAEVLGIRPAMRIVRIDGISCDEANTLERLRRAGRPVTVHFSPPSESASERPPLQTVLSAIRQAIGAGVPLWNRGDYAGCARLCELLPTPCTTCCVPTLLDACVALTAVR
eukprot:COSAG01_NODE_3423_length_6115_cov_3.557347_4_plen_210_part_00